MKCETINAYNLMEMGKAWEIIGSTTENGEVFCAECIGDQHPDSITPIFADAEVSFYCETPKCSSLIGDFGCAYCQTPLDSLSKAVGHCVPCKEYKGVTAVWGNDEFLPTCPTCWDPIDYCQGHGTIG